MNQEIADNLKTALELAIIFNVTQRNVHMWATRGGCPVVRYIRSQPLFYLPDVQKWLAARDAKPRSWSPQARENARKRREARAGAHASAA